MPRVPHSIDKDILAVYQRPPWLPPSDDEYEDESEEGDKMEEDDTEESEEEDDDVDEEEICCKVEDGGVCCFAEEEEEPKKDLEVKRKSEKKSGEKSHANREQSKAKEDWKIQHKDGQDLETDRKICIEKIIDTYRKDGEKHSDEDSEEELGFAGPLRKKLLQEELGSSENEEDEEEDLWEIDSEQDEMMLKSREYDPYDADSDDVIDAGDDVWKEGLVPKLADLAIKTIARNLELFEETELENWMTPKDWNTLIEEEIPMDVPLALSVPMIPESYYWEKACRQEFKKASCYEHGKSWKQMYLEHTCQHYIENLKPSKVARREISDLTELWEPFVLRLTIDQMIVEKVMHEDGTMKWTRVDLARIIPELTLLEEVHVAYGAKDCGLDFEWYKFEVCEADIKCLGESIENLTKLRIFKLHRSIVTDSMCVSLWGRLFYMQSLAELHFIHCCLGNDTAKALATLVPSLPRLVHLDLRNNQIGISGAKALALSLSNAKCNLNYLNLSLNAIQDGGAQSIAMALQSNKALTQLHLGGCSLGPKTFATFAACLKVNSTLLELDLSNNRVTEDAFKTLMDALEQNNVLQGLDVWMPGIDADMLTKVRKRLDINRDMCSIHSRIINPRFNDEFRKYFSLDD